jgi:hypothetical protein
VPELDDDPLGNERVELVAVDPVLHASSSLLV